MHISRNFLLGVLFLVLSFVKIGNTLKCHVCNSLHNDSCDFLEDDRYLVECIKVNDNPQKNHTICRKEIISVTSVEFNLHSSRTIRTCGYQKHPKFSCFYNSNHDLKETICECEEDGCNEGSTLRFTLQFLIYSLLSTYVMSRITT
ncbi:uncharacterized protein LOC129958680 isoform X2 [Argiope bruennichi]|uniref:uncharacterized protein LOC129958680 isoform X2 n=1 Tax=Argiope bruennichi TaxID=94029 RepID=UPI0024948568|nr:uncharacterized protein LOC129958680 isoform X2 [Argiope bruennichi]